MGLRELLRKRDELAMGPAQEGDEDEETVRRLNNGPEFTFIRSDTVSQEVIHPPSGNGHLLSATAPSTATGAPPPSRSSSSRSPRRSLDVFRSRSSRSASVSSQASHLSSPPQQPGTKRRLSQRLHLSRRPEASDNVPQNLPEIVVPADPQDKDGAESQWEKRATMLAGQNELARSRPPSPGPASPATPGGTAQMSLDGSPSSRAPVSSQQTDQDIQEAIRLHEAGHLEKSTVLFARLADPQGPNNPLSQVLYGLALR